MVYIIDWSYVTNKNQRALNHCLFPMWDCPAFLIHNSTGDHTVGLCKSNNLHKPSILTIIIITIIMINLLVNTTFLVLNYIMVSLSRALVLFTYKFNLCECWSTYDYYSLVNLMILRMLHTKIHSSNILFIYANQCMGGRLKK